MNKSFKYLLILILILAVVKYLTILRLESFGKPFNNERAKIGLPVVQDQWKKDRYSSGILKYTNKGAHYEKTIIIDYLHGIIEETDQYSIPNKTIYLTYRYKDKEKWYIRYYLKGEKGEVTSPQYLTYNEFRNLLKISNISFN